LIVATLLAAFLGYSASGALITEAMSAVGTSTWKFTLAITGQMGFGALLAIYLPRMFRRT
jgi:predicted benzoate:H+ symporter BenE